MNLTVQRQTYTEQSTQGELLLEGQHFCWTLEPRRDQSQGKPFCIPAAVYNVILAPSFHFRTVTPHVMNVPDFQNIEIHWGNYPSDTEGCLLLGYDKTADFVGTSKSAFDDLMRELLGATTISIEYKEGS